MSHVERYTSRVEHRSTVEMCPSTVHGVGSDAAQLHAEAASVNTLRSVQIEGAGSLGGGEQVRSPRMHVQNTDHRRCLQGSSLMLNRSKSVAWKASHVSSVPMELASL